MLYRKKPVVIEAWQFIPDGVVREMPLWLGIALQNGTIYTVPHMGLKIVTLEGDMLVSPNDWIIKGVNDELYPCKPDIFKKTYEAVDD